MTAANTVNTNYDLEYTVTNTTDPFIVEPVEIKKEKCYNVIHKKQKIIMKQRTVDNRNRIYARGAI